MAISNKGINNLINLYPICSSNEIQWQGLFSFLKDLLPFINDSQYQSYYKIFSVFCRLLSLSLFY